MNQSPLEGIRVADLTRVVSGPMATRILADMGAEVIKIEPPGGDFTREVLPHVDGVGAYFSQLNTGKKNLSIDLRTERGAGLLRDLVQHCDVLVENFRPGIMEKLGLAPEDALRSHPELVFCSITGYGRSGPWMDRRAYAPLVHAEAGTLEMAARRRGANPVPEVQSHGDVYPATMAANAILAALLHRARTGRGQHVDVSMAEVLAYTNEWSAVELAGGGEIEQLFGAWNSPVLQLASGVRVAVPGNPVFTFPRWIKAMQREELAKDPRFCTADQRMRNRRELLALLQEFVGSFDDVRSLEATLERCNLSLGEVRSVSELADTSWARHRGLVSEVAAGVGVPAHPWISTAMRMGARSGVARLGEHNREILTGLLGLSDQDFTALSAAGVLAG